MSFDSLSGGRRKILMASESGVLAAVNAASGKQGQLIANEDFNFNKHVM